MKKSPYTPEVQLTNLKFNTIKMRINRSNRLSRGSNLLSLPRPLWHTTQRSKLRILTCPKIAMDSTVYVRSGNLYSIAKNI